jgi:hypothetical protein
MWPFDKKKPGQEPKKVYHYGTMESPFPYILEKSYDLEVHLKDGSTRSFKGVGFFDLSGEDYKGKTKEFGCVTIGDVNKDSETTHIRISDIYYIDQKTHSWKVWCDELRDNNGSTAPPTQ